MILREPYQVVFCIPTLLLFADDISLNGRLRLLKTKFICGRRATEQSANLQVSVFCTHVGESLRDSRIPVSLHSSICEEREEAVDLRVTIHGIKLDFGQTLEICWIPNMDIGDILNKPIFGP